MRKIKSYVKCPVCDNSMRERETCSVCGYSESTDYELYKTLGRIEGEKTTIQKCREYKEKIEKAKQEALKKKQREEMEEWKKGFIHQFEEEQREEPRRKAAEEELRRKASEEARQKAVEESRRKVEEEAKRKAEEVEKKKKNESSIIYLIDHIIVLLISGYTIGMAIYATICDYSAGKLNSPWELPLEILLVLFICIFPWMVYVAKNPDVSFITGYLWAFGGMISFMAWGTPWSAFLDEHDAIAIPVFILLCLIVIRSGKAASVVAER